jgi:shikimate dehydrogenase
MPDRYAVVGNPVAHSKSPLIHAEFARQTGELIEYGRVLAPLDAFTATIERFRAEGGKGANVTLPFKEEAFRLATRASDRARRAQAVNTLRFDADAIFGDNTDGVGLTNDLVRNLGVELAGARILLVGAGGAARGVIPSLLEARPAALVVANRTVPRAEELARTFGAPVVARAFDALGGEQFEVVVNATSASLAGEAPALPAGIYARDAVAYDMMYGKGETPFLANARAHGAARLADGLGMLVEQAAESFFIWRGVRPDTAPVLALLRSLA